MQTVLDIIRHYSGAGKEDKDMNKAVYTKDGKRRKNHPPRYIITSTKEPVPEKKLQKINLPGVTFLIGPNGEHLSDNPDFKEWLAADES